MDLRSIKFFGEELRIDEHLALVPTTVEEFLDNMGRVDPHDVPQNRPPPDLHRRFRADHGFFADAGFESARKYEAFNEDHLSTHQ